MEKGSIKNHTSIKPIERSLTPKGNKDVEFNLSKLEKVMENMNYELKQELDAFEANIHANKGDILNELRFIQSWRREGEYEC